MRLLNRLRRNSRASDTIFLNKPTEEEGKKTIVQPKGKRIREKYLYEFVHRTIYTLKDKTRILLSKANYEQWKKPLLLTTIDITYNSVIIAIVILSLNSKNAFLEGLGITLFFILLKSYTKEFHELFKR